MTDAVLADVTSEPPLKLDLNERCEGAPDWALETLAELGEEALWAYRGREDLEAKLARRFGLEPDRVLATNGGDEGIAILLAHLGSRRRVLLPRPLFGFYREQAEIHGLDTLEVPACADLSLDVDKLMAAITADVDLVVMTRPNNPTGEMLAYDQMLRLLEHCREREVLLLLDEAYAEFAEEDMVSALAVFDNLIVLRTFSKAFGLAGIRVGCLLGSRTLITDLRARALPYNLAAPSLILAERALDEDARKEMRAYADAVSRERDRLAGTLRKQGISVPHSHGNFLLLQLDRVRVDLVEAALNQRQIAVRRFSEAELAGCLRITIPADTTRLREVLDLVFEPQLICLDVDGCLIDTRKSFDAVVAAVVAHFTGETIDDEEIYHLRAQGGFNDDNDISHELVRRRGVVVRRDEVVPIFRDFYLGTEERPGLVREETVLIRPSLLTRLRQQYAVALVTGRNREELTPALSLLDLPAEMPAWTIDDVATGKPDPEGILAAAARFEATRTWMVGDNPDDIRAARAAGALPLGVAMGSEQALLAAGATLVLSSINQLEVLL